MLLLHIGYHKTGTTWLRHRFFPRPDLPFHVFSRYDHDMAALLHPNALDYDPAAVRRRYQPGIDAAEAAGKIAVITHERLSGDPHSGGYDSKEMAERLHRTFPDARVLIGIREQRSMILSCYKQYLKYGGACSLADYLKYSGDHRRPQFHRNHLRYHRLIIRYQEMFGGENVLVQPYDRFRTDPAGYVATLAAFLGVQVPADLPYEDRVNVPVKPAALWVKRLMNPFLRRDSLNGYSPYVNDPVSKVGQRIVKLVNEVAPSDLNAQIDADWKALIERACDGYYEESNRITSARIGTDLAQFGYRA
jgi:hypothetical protein